ncbi:MULTISPECIES: toprim domain-containing protein [Streptosporangium]|uniref:DNA primase n=1 Tax=Streptosporangium brasiliense TaxID=47480 RepID=A0ABT9RMC3_9ACTN|nr:toprim domain-containing protein [Streptosporangium brasiliense]MDP9870446.1 DNA primase [Streptosporangium brasiliense]
MLRVDDSGEATCRCPAHMEFLGREDRHPSFSVNIGSGLFACFSCGFKGTFGDLVAYVLKVDRAEAVSWIRARGTIRQVERLMAKKTPATIDTTQQINEASLALYIPPPREALDDRNLTAKACASYGVLWEPTEELWITPVRDENDVLLGWQEKNARYFRNRPKGLKKSHTLFGLHTITYGCSRIIVVESPLDAVRLASAGIENVVASYGASISDAQMQLMLERTQHVVLFLDNDGPGRQYRDKAAAAWRHRIGISSVDYRNLLDCDDPEGLDPGDLSDAELIRLTDLTVPASLMPYLLR